MAHGNGRVARGRAGLAPTTPAVPGTISLAWSPLVLGGLIGLIYWFAMGVDFPASNRRFSRLA